MKKQIYLITISSIAIVMIIFLMIFNATIGVNLNISKGKMTFTNNNFDDIYYLNGEWEVYEGILLATDNLNPSDYPVKYETLPGKKQEGNSKLSYRIVIDNFPQNIPTTVNIQNNTESYSIYLNRVLIKCNHSDHQHLFFYRLENENQLEIIIEVNNESIGYKNLIDSPQILSYRINQKLDILTFAYNFIILGLLAFSIIYIILVHSFQDFRREAIFFALTTIFAIINIIFSPKLYLHFNFSLVVSFYFYYFSLIFITLFFWFFIKKYLNNKKFGAFDFTFYTVIIITLILITALPLKILSLYNLFLKLLNVILLLLILLYSIIYTKKGKFQPFITYMIGLLIVGNIYNLLRDNNIITSNADIMTVIYSSSTFLYVAIITLSHSEKIASAEELVKLNEKIRDTEFTFLNSQIQSHFIYNSLNSIQSLCLIEPMKAADLIEDFSSYLRSRLEFNKMPILIEFADELNNIKTYINIEKERFGERIKYEFDIQIGEFKIPPLSVQPLVENAIKHGLSKKPEGGTLTISTFKDDHYLYIKIEDDGIGFDPSSLSEKQRVGTTNIKDRLALHLDATLEIISEVNVGTTSIIKIPLSKALK